MRVRRSNDQKSCGRGNQNERAKISTGWTHDFSHRQKRRKSSVKIGLYCCKKIIQKPGWIAKAFETCCANKAVNGPAEKRRKSAGGIAMDSVEITPAS